MITGRVDQQWWWWWRILLLVFPSDFIDTFVFLSRNKKRSFSKRTRFFFHSSPPVISPSHFPNSNLLLLRQFQAIVELMFRKGWVRSVAFERPSDHRDFCSMKTIFLPGEKPFFLRHSFQFELMTIFFTLGSGRRSRVNNEEPKPSGKPASLAGNGKAKSIDKWSMDSPSAVYCLAFVFSSLLFSHLIVAFHFKLYKM